MFLPFELKRTRVSDHRWLLMYCRNAVRLAAKMCMFYSLEHEEIWGFLSWCVLYSLWMVFAQKGLISHQYSEPLSFAAPQGSAKSWASIPGMLLHHFLSLKPLVPLKQKSGFLWSVEKRLANNHPSSCWIWGLNLVISEIFSLSLPPLQLAGKEKLWCSRNLRNLISR